LWTNQNKNLQRQQWHQRKQKKEQAAHRKVALQKQLAAQRSKVMDPKVSLHDGDGNDDSTSGIEEAAEASVQTTDDKEGLIQSNKDSKQKSPPPTSIQSYTHTKRPKKLVSSEKSNKQRTSVPDHEKNKKQQDKILMIQLEAKKEIVTKNTKTESDPQRHHPR
jgi:hypothetical protein